MFISKLVDGENKRNSEITIAYLEGTSVAELAAKYGVGKNRIYGIMLRTLELLWIERQNYISGAGVKRAKTLKDIKANRAMYLELMNADTPPVEILAELAEVRDKDLVRRRAAREFFNWNMAEHMKWEVILEARENRMKRRLAVSKELQQTR